MNPTVVLVHGAMHTPWIFEPLRERLTARGIASRAVQLPSSNPDSAATEGLTEDVAVVRTAIQAVDGPVVLAAHSYGGVPTTWAAAEEDRIAELVYIAAFALEPGTSMMEWMGGNFPPTWIHSPDRLAVKAGDAEQSIFSGVDPALTAEAVKRLNWQGLRAFTEKLGAAPTQVPLTYVVATEDPALPPAVQEQWATHAAHNLRIPSGHSPHLSHTDEIATLLTQAVARAQQ
ncbi:Pimeloyl-ACP methyl ester carboxylesterase [Streptomyces sp. 3213]|uniref:alpha/beta fold hydrolase n=1 Tax=Streptomyces sp. 3213.3 TaxID=1855348 RepID=UPI00089BF9FC|nr:alpha/beta hydrolase [Streptomyces sp. 3213.3]SEC32968.1 Pimeloyl-ACP methyl ester carboxylesterase [Streptomyces sp. 3213] [Streptomyces sp. 3213.3]